MRRADRIRRQRRFRGLISPLHWQAGSASARSAACNATSTRAPCVGAGRSWFHRAVVAGLLVLAALAAAPRDADAAPPTVNSAAVTGRELVLTFSEKLDKTAVPAADAFTVQANGHKRPVSELSIEGSDVTLTLGEETIAGETVTVSYSKPRDLSHFDLRGPATFPKLQGISGNQADSFTNQAVTNNSAACPGTVSGAFWTACLTVDHNGVVRGGYARNSGGKLSSTSSPGKARATVSTVSLTLARSGGQPRSLLTDSPCRSPKIRARRQRTGPWWSATRP